MIRKGVAKKPIKQGFLPALLEIRIRAKRRERPEVKTHHHFYIAYLWP